MARATKPQSPPAPLRTPPETCRRFPYRARRAACLALLIAASGLGTAHARRHHPTQASAPDIAAKKADLGELRDRIKAMSKDLDASVEDKADAADQLRQSEQQISRLQGRLHRLGQQRGQLENRLQNLGQQAQQLEATLARQQTQLEQLLYKQYLRGTPDSLQLLLNGDDPNQMARDLHYMSAIAQRRAEMMSDLRASLSQQEALAADTRERSKELAGIEDEQRQQQDELEKQRAERKALYASLSDKIRTQRKEIGNLKANERRLTGLIDHLAQMLADQAEKAARAKAARAAAARRPREASAPPRREDSEVARRKDGGDARQDTEAGVENRYEPAPNDGSFLRLKGQLRLPVRGTVIGRFGARRDGETTWRGLFIKAGTGSEVRAVANGRVVFADWMRGFGNLLIIDHGDAYLSIYGDNDALLKQVGQAVRGGETIATVGNTGGNPESGLYFELRHKGQPIDPMIWAKLK